MSDLIRDTADVLEDMINSVSNGVKYTYNMKNMLKFPGYLKVAQKKTRKIISKSQL